VKFQYEIHRADGERLGDRLVSGHTIHACINRDGRVVRLPADLRAAVGLSPAASAREPA